jgi:hypothetical protein
MSKNVCAHTLVCVCVCVMSLNKYLSRIFMWIILLIYKLMKIILVHKQTFEGLSVIISYIDHVRESEVYGYDFSVTWEQMF